MSLPEISDVQRLRLEPGDVAVVRLAPGFITAKDADEVRAEVARRVRAAVGRDVPVLVLAAGNSISAEPMDAGVPAACEGRAPAGAPVPGSPVNPAREVG